MSQVKIIQKQVGVCKESSEILHAVAHLVAEIKAGKNAIEIAGSSLPKLMVAVEGAQDVDDEVKAPEFIDTVALGGAEIVKAVLVKKA